MLHWFIDPPPSFVFVPFEFLTTQIQLKRMRLPFSKLFVWWCQPTRLVVEWGCDAKGEINLENDGKMSFQTNMLRIENLKCHWFSFKKKMPLVLFS